MLQLPETSAVSPIALVRMSGSMEKSTDVMKAMQSLIKVADIQQTMQALSREMTKAGIIGELMEDTFESLEDDDLEEEADDAVEAILFEVTKGQLGKAGAISNKPLDVKVRLPT
jgi:charged multivesicular body protein 3